MNWTDYLTAEADEAYNAADGLMARVDEGSLAWAPESGANWMNTGQLLKHLTDACGAVAHGFATDDWSSIMPAEGAEGMDTDGMASSAAVMPTAESVARAREQLAADRARFAQALESVGEDALASKIVPAPWNPTPRALGYQLHTCVEHLVSHKSQLFYYLKLMGQPVHTGDLWGMPDSAQVG